MGVVPETRGRAEDGAAIAARRLDRGDEPAMKNVCFCSATNSTTTLRQSPGLLEQGVAPGLAGDDGREQARQSRSGLDCRLMVR